MQIFEKLCLLAYNTFDDEGMSDFFGKNISVSAIVGKNGCGKSTLMDIIIMIVNK